MTIFNADWDETMLARPVPHAVDEPARDATGELMVSTTVTRRDLGRLLDSLAGEDRAHSWKNFDSASDLEDLLRWENRYRPTEIFFFYLKCGEELRILGAGAVAEHLNSRFTDPGFCVLGRCYIMSEFRGRGYYRRLLQLRLDHCRARFGDSLKAVHLGSDNERIAHVVTGQPLPGWPRFLHLGDEELEIAGRSKLVNAYIVLLPDFARRLACALDGPCAPPLVAALRDRLAGIEGGEPRNLGLAVRDAIADARRRGWLGERNTAPIDQLLAFCRAVPLVGFP